MPIRDDFTVAPCDWATAADREAMTSVRERVFVLEQHVPPAMEIDADDPRCVHVLARALDGTPIGTGRLAIDAPPATADAVPDPADTGTLNFASDPPAPQATPRRATGRIGRMAVLPGWRRCGVGSMLLETLLGIAQARGLAAISLHAQHDAIPFYARHGFAGVGAEFEEAGIRHVTMTRTLPPPEPPERPVLPPAPQPIVLQAASREEFIAATLQLLTRARHGVCLRVRELHPQVFDDTASLVELRRLAISGRAAAIRIIAQDLTRALHEGTRLLELARRLSSGIEIRRPTEPADLEYPSAFLCVDTQGFLFRPLECAMHAIGSTWAPGRHAQLMRVFEDVWARSETWPELRTLGI
ncbi:MAG TPA: GNAT family N-acetyltransferase [Rhodanobacteraceae bacterium]